MAMPLEHTRIFQYLSRKLIPLATGIALLIAVLAPVTFWVIAHHSQQQLISLYAENLADQIRLVAQESPSLWKYQAYKFIAIAERFSPLHIDVTGFRILDENGELISKHDYHEAKWGKPGKNLTFTEELQFTLTTAPIHFNDRRIGTVEVLADDTRLLRTNTLLFCLSSLIGITLAVLVYRFPVRVVRKMEGEIEELMSTVQQSEERYRSLVEMSLVGVYIIVDGIFRYVNPKFAEIFDWSREELIEKKGPVDLTLPDDWPTVEQNLRKRFSGEISSINYEFRGVTKDNRVIFLEVFGCRITYQGQPAVIGTLLDISKRKRAEEQVRNLTESLELRVEGKTRQLLDAQEKLIRKEKLSILGQLSGCVGHELRNPLGVMSNAVYFLKMVHADGDESTREYLDIIKHEIDNSQRIITDLLDFARTKTPQTKTISVPDLLSGSLGNCTIPDDVSLQNEITGSLPLLKIDPLQMEQIFQNLITNAVQAMPDGGTLCITAHQRVNVGAGLVPTHDQEGQPQELPLQTNEDFIEISIIDTGEGILTENLNKLFQPLFTTKAKGIGLGLVVCKNLVEANGGRIEVESEPGKGTTFRVMLPIYEEQT